MHFVRRRPKTRRGASYYHESDEWFKDAEHLPDYADVENAVDSGGAALKSAVSEFENSWYVAAALTMTVGFAFLMLKPASGQPWQLDRRLCLPHAGALRNNQRDARRLVGRSHGAAGALAPGAEFLQVLVRNIEHFDGTRATVRQDLN